MRYDAEGVERLQDRRLGHPSRRLLSQHTVRFMVRATEPGTTYVPRVGMSFADILCVQDERL
jgi:hypothetical protein